MSGVANDGGNKRLVDKIGQFVTIPYSFIQQSKELSFHACWLFVVLRYYTNGQSGKAFPSYKTIRNLTKMRNEMIAKSLRELEGKGWLTKTKRFGNSNLYTVNVPPPPVNGQQSVAVSDVSAGEEETYQGGDAAASRPTPEYGIPLSDLYSVFSRKPHTKRVGN